MKYLFLLYADAPMPEPGTPEARKLLEDWTEAEQAMAEAGVLIDCAPLHPVAASTTVRVRDGETLLTDGPAARSTGCGERAGGRPRRPRPRGKRRPSGLVRSVR